MNLVIGFFTGLVVSLIAAVWLRALAKRRGILRKVGTPLSTEGPPLPPVGGLALAVGLVAGITVWARLEGIAWGPMLSGLTVSALLIFIVGWLDDYVRELNPWQKLFGQIIACSILIRSGFVTQIVMLPPWANMAVTVLWMLVMMNAFNLLDIVDGLAIGIAVIVTGVFALLAWQAGQPVIAGVLVMLEGGLLAVWAFNFPKATLFLGDSGSLVIGLVLASLSLAISYAATGREVALLTPIVVLGVPIFDLVFVTWARLRNGRSILRKSRDHIVFRLMQTGWSSTRAVTAMLFLCLAFAAVAIVIRRASNPAGLAVLGVLLIGTILWARRIAKVSVNS